MRVQGVPLLTVTSEAIPQVHRGESVARSDDSIAVSLRHCPGSQHG